MDRFGKFKEVAEAVGVFVLLLGILAIILHVIGIQNSVFASFKVLGYFLVGIALAFGAALGLMIGQELWRSEALWKKVLGGVVTLASSVIGIAFILYVYGGIDNSDCPAGLPMRYC